MKIPNGKFTNMQLLGHAMEIKTQKEANEYFEALVEYHMNMFKIPREESEKDVKSNLGYWAGYYDNKTMKRVNKLFKTSHPVFGNVVPTPEEAFKMGEDLGKEISSKKL